MCVCVGGEVLRGVGIWYHLHGDNDLFGPPVHCLSWVPSAVYARGCQRSILRRFYLNHGYLTMKGVSLSLQAKLVSRWTSVYKLDLSLVIGEHIL